MSPLHPRMLCAQIDIGQMILEGKILKFCQCIFAYHKYPPLKRAWLFFWTFESLIFQGCFVSCLDEIGFVVLEKKILKFRQNECIVAKLEPPIPKDVLWQVWLQLIQWSGRKRFLNVVKAFPHFVIIYPWKRVWPFNWTDLNFHHPRMLCTKFDWNWF